MDKSQIYLDHAAATPIDERVLEVMTPYFSQKFFNPSSPYQPALAVRRDYQAAKETIGQQIGAKGDEIIITAGATESINLAFSSATGQVVVSAVEHDSVLKAATSRNHKVVGVNRLGMVDLAELERTVTAETTLVSVQLANNELGTIQPLRDVAEIIKRERQRRLAFSDHTPLFLHSDASQGVGQLTIQVARLGVDLLTLNAGKLYGPKQVGALWVSRGVRLKPQIVGGGQEAGLRSGTENVAGVVGFARAIELVSAAKKPEAERLSKLRDDFEKIVSKNFPTAVFSGHRKHRLANFSHVSFPKIDAERLIFALETRGVFVATGSACAANKGTRSHVLEAIGLDDNLADGSLRLTFGHLSTVENSAMATKIICEEVGREYDRIRA